MNLKKSKRKHREALDFSLNITSLMDVLTVLLFFLIKSFSVTSSIEAPSAELKLPTSSIQGKLSETVSVALSSKGIRVQDINLIEFADGKIRLSDLGPDGHTIPALQKNLAVQLTARNENLKKSAHSTGKSETDQELPPGKILVQSDKDMPFGTLKLVLQTAAEAGYSDYQFVVLDPKE